MDQQTIGDSNSVERSSILTTASTCSIPVARIKHDENCGTEPILFPQDRLAELPWDNISDIPPAELQIPSDHDIELILAKKNRLCALFSSPLVYLVNGNVRALPMLDYSEEKNVITQAFEDARKDITVHFNFANTTTLSESLTAGFRALHISGHGHVNGLLFEDGRGNVHFLNSEAIISICEGMKEKWDFVFLSCNHSHEVGEAFVAAGVPHVICITSKFLDISANAFSRALYLALAEGKTVQEAFDIGKKMVVHCPGVIRNQMSISSEDEAQKFLLLPRGDSHNVPIFIASQVATWPPRRSECPGNFPYDFPRTHLLPRIPKDFVGREVDTYMLVNEILNNRAVQLQGPEGIGKTVVAAATGRYMMERKLFKNGVIFLELAGINTFQEFLYALVRVLRIGFPIVMEKMGKLSMSMGSGGGAVDCCTTSLPSMEQRKALKTFHKMTLQEIPCEKDTDSDSVKNQAELLLTSLDSANFLLILDHANALTLSGGKRHEDCTAFLCFIDRLLNRCSDVRVLLTTTDNQKINPGFGTYNERKQHLPPLNLHSSLRLFTQLSSVFTTGQQRNDFIGRFIRKQSEGNAEHQEALARFCMKLFMLLGQGNPSMIHGTVSGNDQQTYKHLCELLE